MLLLLNWLAELLETRSCVQILDDILANARFLFFAVACMCSHSGFECKKWEKTMRLSVLVLSITPHLFLYFSLVSWPLAWAYHLVKGYMSRAHNNQSFMNLQFWYFYIILGCILFSSSSLFFNSYILSIWQQGGSCVCQVSFSLFVHYGHRISNYTCVARSPRPWW